MATIPTIPGSKNYDGDTHIAARSGFLPDGEAKCAGSVKRSCAAMISPVGEARKTKPTTRLEMRQGGLTDLPMLNTLQYSASNRLDCAIDLFGEAKSASTAPCQPA